MEADIWRNHMIAIIWNIRFVSNAVAQWNQRYYVIVEALGNRRLPHA
jgi:hypothetical protein